MSRTAGYYVRLLRQGVDAAEEMPSYLRDGGEPQLFATKKLAQEMAEAYLEDKPEFTFALEPVVR